MDINFSSTPPNLTQNSAQTTGTTSTSGNASEGVDTLQTNPDTVVSQSNSPGAPQNETKNQPDNSATSNINNTQQELDTLNLSGRRTQVGFNNELNKVFLEVVDTRTEQVIEQIPSEKFVRFVHERLEEPSSRDDDEPNGAVIDEAV